MIGTSNCFELAVAVAISEFGLHAGAALATVVGGVGGSAGDVVAGRFGQAHPAPNHFDGPVGESEPSVSPSFPYIAF